MPQKFGAQHLKIAEKNPSMFCGSFSRATVCSNGLHGPLQSSSAETDNLLLQAWNKSHRTQKALPEGESDITRGSPTPHFANGKVCTPNGRRTDLIVLRLHLSELKTGYIIDCCT